LSARTRAAERLACGRLRRWRPAFAGIRAAFPDVDGTRAEVAWSALHGLATLQAAGRLTPGQAQARLDLLHRLLTQQENPS
jgi:hypothetical protein